MKKYDNFCAALDILKEIYDYEEPYGNVVLTDFKSCLSGRDD